MRSETIQNILLVILVLANLILVGFGARDIAIKKKNDENYLTYASNILSEKKVELSESVKLNSSSFGTVIDVEDAEADFTVLAAKFFKCHENELSVFAIPGGGMSVAYKNESFGFSSDGRISYRIGSEQIDADVTSAHSGTDVKEASSGIKKSAKAFIKALGGLGEARIANSFQGDNGDFYVLCTQAVDGIEVYGTTFVLRYDVSEKLLAAEGVWYFGNAAEEYKAEIYGKADALFFLTESVNECRIEMIELMYRYMPYGNGGYMLVPTYSVKASKDGHEQYFSVCAVSGRLQNVASS